MFRGKEMFKECHICVSVDPEILIWVFHRLQLVIGFWQAISNINQLQMQIWGSGFLVECGCDETAGRGMFLCQLNA